LKQLGARGTVRPAPHALQVVVGATADQLAGELRTALHGATTTAGSTSPATPAAHSPAVGAAAAGPLPDAAALLAALGGRANVRDVVAAASRLRVSVRDSTQVDGERIRGLGLRGVAVPLPGCVHVIVGPGAAAALAQLKSLLG
jgi:PTS system N-acetylglucosamine-specific IIC component